MLLELIVILGIKVLFVEPKIFKCENLLVSSCYREEIVNNKIQNRQIILSYQDKDLNWSLYHELGHALFVHKDVSIIDGYQILPSSHVFYKSKNYQGEDLRQEMIADYFAEYVLNNKEFSIKHPSLYIFFRDNIKLFLNEGE